MYFLNFYEEIKEIWVEKVSVSILNLTHFFVYF